MEKTVTKKAAQKPKGVAPKAEAGGALPAYRSHNCGELRPVQVGQTARLSGWVHRVRDHGGLLFIDLRDHYGITQCVVEPESPAFGLAEKVRAEWVIRVDGTVEARTAETVNPNMATGGIELRITGLDVLSEAAELPLPVAGEPDYPEDTRLQYRFLDLRRETLHRNIMKRAAIISSLRRRMNDAGFFEFQTPILTASSPEGARDFLVPSRMHPGKFYALPQAPQQFKQLIMIAGFDRYFQIAPCFRDEDARADRSPGEFYQLDIEMSFVEQEDVFQAVEPVLRDLFVEFAGGKPVTELFPRIPYDQAIAKYGSDKPDLRNPIVMQDVSDRFRGSGFKIFAGMLEKNPKARVWAIPAPTGGSRAFCDRMNAWAQAQGQPGLAYIFWRDRENYSSEDLVGLPNRLLSQWHKTSFDEFFVGYSGDYLPGQLSEMERTVLQELIGDFWQKNDKEGALLLLDAYFGKIEGTGPIAKNIGPIRTEYLRRQLGLKEGDAVFFTAGDPGSFYKFAGEARNRIGNELGLVQKDRFEFCWITDFPFYEWNEEEKKIDFSHNPFSMPQGGMEALTAAKTEDELLALKAYQYDIVCNGIELSSGAIRNHKPELMYKAFEIAGYGPEVVDAKFGGMIRALKFGAPPHGGIAPGIDRMVMLLCGAENLRDVTMFPLNQKAEDLLMGAPSEVSPRQLQELHIRLNLPKK